MESQIVEYNLKSYAVINLTNKLFIIDYEDFDKIKDAKLKYTKNDYINGYFRDNILTFLHIYIMNQPKNKTVDHITRNPRDNRKNVLKLASQTEQNQNTKRRARTVKLPDDCDIEDKDIPRHVWYIHPNGNHGDGFTIQLKGYNCFEKEEFRWKSSRSKNISLKEKLQQTITKLYELRDTYSELHDVIILQPEHEDKRRILTNEFNDIIKLSNYDDNIIQNSLFDFKSDLQVPIRKIKKEIPSSSGITQDMIPENCKYIPGDEWRGDRFGIMNYDKLSSNKKKYWYTTSSESISLKEKYDELINELNKFKLDN